MIVEHRARKMANAFGTEKWQANMKLSHQTISKKSK